tara:strand:+ start:12008 stop:13810 length:1803 start_codon:yes stop_codon:yes gene_type:complete
MSNTDEKEFYRRRGEAVKKNRALKKKLKEEHEEKIRKKEEEIIKKAKDTNIDKYYFKLQERKKPPKLIKKYQDLENTVGKGKDNNLYVGVAARSDSKEYDSYLDRYYNQGTNFDKGTFARKAGDKKTEAFNYRSKEYNHLDRVFRGNTIIGITKEKSRFFNNQEDMKNYVKQLNLNPFGNDSKLEQILIDRVNNNKVDNMLYIEEVGKNGKFTIKHKIPWDGTIYHLELILGKYYYFGNIKNVYYNLLNSKDTYTKNNTHLNNVLHLYYKTGSFSGGDLFISYDNLRKDVQIFDIYDQDKYERLTLGLQFLFFDLESKPVKKYFLPWWLPDFIYDKVDRLIDDYLNFTYKSGERVSDTRIKNLSEVTKEAEKKFSMGRVADAIYAVPEREVFMESMSRWAQKENQGNAYDPDNRAFTYAEQGGHERVDGQGDRKNTLYGKDLDPEYAKKLLTDDEARIWLSIRALNTNKRIFDVERLKNPQMKDGSQSKKDNKLFEKDRNIDNVPLYQYSKFNKKELERAEKKLDKDDFLEDLRERRQRVKKRAIDNYIDTEMRESDKVSQELGNKYAKETLENRYKAYNNLVNKFDSLWNEYGFTSKKI